jgi:CheY-like chemotaxis protein
MEEKRRILIVDDNHSLVTLAKLVLEKNGYDTLSAFDGLEGLEKARSEKPDLIILDIAMPKMDGYEVCRQLKSDPDTAKIATIILSAKGEINENKKATEVSLNEVFKGFDIGANNFLTKPVSARELLEAVKSEFSFSAFLGA